MPRYIQISEARRARLRRIGGFPAPLPSNRQAYEIYRCLSRYGKSQIPRKIKYEEESDVVDRYVRYMKENGKRVFLFVMRHGVTVTLRVCDVKNEFVGLYVDKVLLNGGAIPGTNFMLLDR